ncbi:uncharacterized protein LOC129790873 [Lutzomyia longipalpis]|uniref:uncharacterized protein LOC129790873 n=1 Tax=Lutzomyia longipalpis TaxID=7200 RepID=UPI002483A311|nr:uncharacterized protein LOC129790873 [Lutzomyia longipalpis]
MRALVLISSFAVVAFARPDVSHLTGYNYNHPSGSAGASHHTASRVSVDMVPSQSYEIPASQSTFTNLGSSSNVASNQYVPPRVQTHFSAPATTLLTPTAGSSVSGSAPSVNFITYADNQNNYVPPTAPTAHTTGFAYDHASSALPAFPTLSTPVRAEFTQLNTDHGSSSFGQTTGFGQNTGFSHGQTADFGHTSSGSFSQGFNQGFSQGGLGQVTQGVAHNEEIQLTGRFDQSATHVNFPPQRIIQQTAPFVTKHTYVFAAPEEEEHIAPQEPIVLPQPQTHYKIIFIKAPSTTIVNNQGGAVAPQKNEKTIIYVLSNKRVIDRTVEVPDLPEQKKSKPEVFFIKYKTPTEHVDSQAVYETVDHVDGHAAGLSPRFETNQVQHEGVHSAGITVAAPQQNVQMFSADAQSQGAYQTLHSSSVQEIQNKPTLTSYDSPVYSLDTSGFGSSSGSAHGSASGSAQFGGSSTSGSALQFLNTGFAPSGSQATNLEYIPPVGGSSCTTC